MQYQISDREEIIPQNERNVYKLLIDDYNNISMVGKQYLRSKYKNLTLNRTVHKYSTHF